MSYPKVFQKALHVNNRKRAERIPKKQASNHICFSEKLCLPRKFECFWGERPTEMSFPCFFKQECGDEKNQAYFYDRRLEELNYAEKTTTTTKASARKKNVAWLGAPKMRPPK